MPRILMIAREGRGYTAAPLSRNAFPITLTLLKLMAAAAMMGESRIPKNGKSTPAAIRRARSASTSHA